MNERATFLQQRKLGLGGSDIAAVVGLSNWSTPYDIWEDKMTPEVDDDEQTEFMYWGNRLEDVVADEYKIRSGNKVQRVNAQLVHPKHDFARANIDRAVVNPDIAGNVRWKDGRLTTDRLLECKTSNAFTKALWGEVETDEVPHYYLVQCLWYLGITSADVCDLSVLIGGNDFRTYTIERDQEIIDDLLHEGEKFWKLVQDGIAPDAQSMDDVKKMWPQHVAAKEVIVDYSVAQRVSDYHQLGEQIKELEAARKQAQFDICSSLEDAEALCLTNGGERLATYKTQSSTRLDTKRLKAERPEIFEDYATTSTTRVLRISKAGKELA